MGHRVDREEMSKFWSYCWLLFLLTIIMSVSAYPAWLHTAIKRSASAGSYQAAAFDRTRYSCNTNENDFAVCYLCGKVLESEQVLKKCCRTSGDVRNFCFDLLS